MRRAVVGLIALLFAFQSGLPAQGADSAKAFVESVYRDYANPDLKHQEQRQAKFYTVDLYRLIVADRTGHPGYVGKLDGDPICDCQDAGNPGDLRVQSIKLMDAGQSKMKAEVLFTIVSESRTVTLSLLATSAGWRIDDVAAKDMPSLRALLRR